VTCADIGIRSKDKATPKQIIRRFIIQAPLKNIPDLSVPKQRGEYSKTGTAGINPYDSKKHPPTDIVD
jgi:hypothetical protein